MPYEAIRANLAVGLIVFTYTTSIDVKPPPRPPISAEAPKRTIYTKPITIIIGTAAAELNQKGITIAEGIDDCSNCIGSQSQTNRLPDQRITLRTFLLIDLPDQSSLRMAALLQ
jgi:hypothetical protein